MVARIAWVSLLSLRFAPGYLISGIQPLRIEFEPVARRGGSAFAKSTAGQVRSRHRLQGSLSGGGGWNARPVRNHRRWQPPLACAAHLVAVSAIVADHLGALVGDMLGDGGQEVGGGEDLEVAVDLGIEPGAVDDPCHPSR